MYVILKHVKNKTTGKTLPVIVLGGENEILEFENPGRAEEMCNIFRTNTDSGHTYEVKKIGL
jgi:hypothetical protein